ncbi:MAG: hypothetical protein LBT00_13330, partial [Spirochaetaceae bacterium]|nr:hypothetical protein [Spirochaetaceae bacterium]
MKGYDDDEDKLLEKGEDADAPDAADDSPDFDLEPDPQAAEQERLSLSAQTAIAALRERWNSTVIPAEPLTQAEATFDAINAAREEAKMRNAESALKGSGGMGSDWLGGVLSARYAGSAIAKNEEDWARYNARMAQAQMKLAGIAARANAIAQTDAQRTAIKRHNYEMQKHQKRTGQRFMRDGDGILQPETTEDGKPVFDEANLGEIAHHETKKPVLGRRDNEGTIHYSLPNAEHNREDPTDPNLYHYFPKSGKVLIGHVDDLVNSPDAQTRKVATAANKKRRDAISDAMLKPIEAQRNEADKTINDARIKLDNPERRAEIMRLTSELDALNADPDAKDDGTGYIFGIGGSALARERHRVNRDKAAAIQSRLDVFEQEDSELKAILDKDSDQNRALDRSERLIKNVKLASAKDEYEERERYVRSSAFAGTEQERKQILDAIEAKRKELKMELSERGKQEAAEEAFIKNTTKAAKERAAKVAEAFQTREDMEEFASAIQARSRVVQEAKAKLDTSKTPEEYKANKAAFDAARVAFINDSEQFKADIGETEKARKAAVSAQVRQMIEKLEKGEEATLFGDYSYEGTVEHMRERAEKSLDILRAKEKAEGGYTFSVFSQDLLSFIGLEFEALKNYALGRSKAHATAILEAEEIKDFVGEFRTEREITELIEKTAKYSADLKAGKNIVEPEDSIAPLGHRSYNLGTLQRLINSYKNGDEREISTFLSSFGSGVSFDVTSFVSSLANRVETPDDLAKRHVLQAEVLRLTDKHDGTSDLLGSALGNAAGFAATMAAGGATGGAVGSVIPIVGTAAGTAVGTVSAGLGKAIHIARSISAVQKIARVSAFMGKWTLPAAMMSIGEMNDQTFSWGDLAFNTAANVPVLIISERIPDKLSDRLMKAVRQDGSIARFAAQTAIRLPVASVNEIISDPISEGLNGDILKYLQEPEKAWKGNTAAAIGFTIFEAFSPRKLRGFKFDRNTGRVTIGQNEFQRVWGDYGETRLLGDLRKSNAQLISNYSETAKSVSSIFGSALRNDGSVESEQAKELAAILPQWQKDNWEKVKTEYADALNKYKSSIEESRDLRSEVEAEATFGAWVNGVAAAALDINDRFAKYHLALKNIDSPTYKGADGNARPKPDTVGGNAATGEGGIELAQQRVAAKALVRLALGAGGVVDEETGETRTIPTGEDAEALEALGKALGEPVFDRDENGRTVLSESAFKWFNSIAGDAAAMFKFETKAVANARIAADRAQAGIATPGATGAGATGGSGAAATGGTAAPAPAVPQGFSEGVAVTVRETPESVGKGKAAAPSVHNSPQERDAYVFHALAKALNRGNEVQAGSPAFARATNIFNRLTRAVNRYAPVSLKGKGKIFANGVRVIMEDDGSGGVSYDRNTQTLVVSIGALAKNDGSTGRLSAGPSTSAKGAEAFRNANLRFELLINEEAIHAIAVFVAKGMDVSFSQMWDAMSGTEAARDIIQVYLANKGDGRITKKKAVELYELRVAEIAEKQTGSEEDKVKKAREILSDSLFHEYVRAVVQGRSSFKAITEMTSFSRTRLANFFARFISLLKDYARRLRDAPTPVIDKIKATIENVEAYHTELMNAIEGKTEDEVSDKEGDGAKPDANAPPPPADTEANAAAQSAQPQEPATPPAKSQAQAAPPAKPEPARQEPIQQPSLFDAAPVSGAKSTIEELNVSDVRLSDEVKQFKENADERGVVRELGKFNPNLSGLILVWRRKDGRLEVVSGRHRLAAAQRDGFKTIVARVFNESDGFSVNDAKVIDAYSNILDDKGAVSDYVRFFRDRKLTEEQAREAGLLYETRGTQGFYIGTYGSADLQAAFLAGNIGVEKTAAIAKGAPNNAEFQAEAMRFSADATVYETADYIRSITAISRQAKPAEQLDLFGFDLGYFEESKKMAKAAASMRNELIRERGILAKVQGMNSKQAKATLKANNVSVSSEPESIRERIAQLDKENAELENWHLDRDLVNAVRARAGLDIIDDLKLPPPAEKTKAISGEPKTVDAGGKDGAVGDAPAPQATAESKEPGISGDASASPAPEPLSPAQAPAEVPNRLNIQPVKARLTPAQRNAEASFANSLNNRTDAEIDAEYDALPESHGGTVFGADHAKELSPEYRNDRRAMNVAVHGPASTYATDRFRRELAKVKAEDRGANTVVV